MVLQSSGNGKSRGGDEKRSSADCFLDTLRQAGVEYTDVDQEFRFMNDDADHRDFVKRLQKVVLQMTQAEIDRFVGSFTQLFVENVSAFLQPVASSKYSDQETVARSLLLNDKLQPQVAPFLLEYLSTAIKSGNTPLCRMIIRQFRYLDTAVNSDKLYDAVFGDGGILIRLPSPVKEDLVKAIPEFIHDLNVQLRVCDRLIEMMEDGASGDLLLMAILDAFCLLSVPADRLSQMRESVKDKLKEQSCGTRTFSHIVRFCLNKSDTSKAKAEEMDELCRLIKAERYLKPTNESRDMIETLGVFEKELQLSDRATGKALLDSICGRNQITVFDFMILLVLLKLDMHEKSTMKPIKSIISADARKSHKRFSPDLFHATLAFQEVIDDKFGSVLKLSENLIRWSGGGVDLGKAFYFDLFLMLDTDASPIETDRRGALKQEIVMLLVGFVSSSVSDSSAALDCLLDLVKAKPKSLLPFEIFIRHLVDNLELLHFDNVKKLFEILFLLYEQSDDDGDSACDDLNITLTKYIGSSLLQKKIWGMFGNLMRIKAIALTSGEWNSTVRDTLQLLQERCRCDRRAKALLCDELVDIVRLFPQGTFPAGIDGAFISEFCVSLSDRSQNGTCVMFGNQEGGAKLCINIAGILANGTSNLMSLCSEFRLLVTSSMTSDSPQLVEFVNNLLDVPLLMPEGCAEDPDESMSSSANDTACTALFYAVDWLRETLNASNLEGDDAQRRYADLMRAQRLLENKIKDLSQFVVPSCRVDGEAVSLSSDGKSVVLVADCAKKQRGRKRKLQDDNGEEDGGDNDNEQRPGPSNARVKAVAPKQQPQRQRSLSFDQLRHFFRPLKLPVLVKILTHYADNHTTLVKNDVVDYGAMFLLELMNEVFKRTFPPVSTKRVVSNPFFLRKSSAPKPLKQTSQDSRDANSHVPDIIRSLVNVIDAAYTVFEIHFTENNGVRDNQFAVAKESFMVAQLWQIGFECLTTILNSDCFATNNFNVKQVMKFLTPQKSNAKHLLKECTRMVERAPTIGCAMSVIDAVTVLAKLEKDSDATSDGLRQKIDDLVGEMGRSCLETSWCEEAKGAAMNSKVRRLIEWNVANPAAQNNEDSEETETPPTQRNDRRMVAVLEMVKSIADMVDTSIRRSLPDDDDTEPSSPIGILEEHRSLYPVFYRVLFAELVKTVSEFPTKDVVKAAAYEAPVKERCINLWRNALKVFHLLVTIVKLPKFANSSYYGTVLREGRRFLDAYIGRSSGVLYLMQSDIRRYPILVDLIKLIQPSTRIMQHVMNDCKTTLKAPARFVPELRSSLERFVRVINTVFRLNGVDHLIQVGLLKNTKATETRDANEQEGDEEGEPEDDGTVSVVEDSDDATSDERRHHGDGEDDTGSTDY